MSTRTYGGRTADEIKSAAQAATPGRRFPRWGGEPGYITIAGEPIGEIYAAKTDSQRNPDLDFICITDPTVVLDLLARVAELEALDAWACEGCGARFPRAEPPEMLKGVTHCSRCVEVRVLDERLTKAQRAADGMRETLELEHSRVSALEGALARLVKVVETQTVAEHQYREWCEQYRRPNDRLANATVAAITETSEAITCARALLGEVRDGRA